MSASVVLLALGVGAVAGVAVVLLIIWVLRQRRMDNEKTSGDLPRGVAQLVSKLDGAVLVLDKSLNVLIASDATSRLSLSGNGRLLIPELVLIAEQAAQGKSVSREDFEISRGPLGDATLTVTVHASPFRNRFVLLSVIDRGEYQRLDDVRREFVANVSHELKTPIASVGLLAEALVEAADEPDTVRHFAVRLTKESQRLGAITREIIELSRLQAEGALAEFAPVTVETVVMNALEQNRVMAKSRKIKLATGGDLDAVVYGDAESLTVAATTLGWIGQPLRRAQPRQQRHRTALREAHQHGTLRWNAAGGLAVEQRLQQLQQAIKLLAADTVFGSAPLMSTSTTGPKIDLSMPTLTSSAGGVKGMAGIYGLRSLWRALRFTLHSSTDKSYSTLTPETTFFGASIDAFTQCLSHR